MTDIGIKKSNKSSTLANNHSNAKRKYIDNNNNNNKTKQFKSNNNNNNNKYNKYKQSNNKYNKDNKDNKPKAYTREERKVLKKQRKLLKPNAELINSVNNIWSIQINKLSKDEQHKHIDNVIYTLQYGVVSESQDNNTKQQQPTTKTTSNIDIVKLSNKHDVSRVIQLSLKYGSIKQRQQIADLYKQCYITMIENKYSYYIVIKLLQYIYKYVKNDIRNALISNIYKLCYNKYAIKVIDYLYALSNNQYEQNIMLVEFYHTELISLMKLEPEKFTNKNNCNLSYILSLYPNKKQKIIDNLLLHYERLVDKELLLFRIFHHLLYETMINLSTLLINNTVYNGLLNAVSVLYYSDYGSEILCWLISYSNTKERKNIIRSLRNKYIDMCNNTYGSVCISQLCYTIDDTVLVNKNIIHDIKDNIKNIMNNNIGQKTILSLLSPLNNTYLNKNELKLYRTSIKRIDSELIELCYKKSIVNKQTELLANLLPTLIKYYSFDTSLLTLLDNNNNVRSHNILYELIRETNERIEMNSYSNETDNLSIGLDTIYELLAIHSVNNDNINQSYICHYTIHRLYKRILTQLKYEYIEKFIDLLYNHIEQYIVQLSCINRSAFVLCTLYTVANNDIKHKIKQQLQPYINDIKAAITQHDNDNNNKQYNALGCELLYKILNNDQSVDIHGKYDNNKQIYSIRNNNIVIEMQKLQQEQQQNNNKQQLQDNVQGNTISTEQHDNIDDIDDNDDQIDTKEYGSEYKQKVEITDDEYDDIEDDNDYDIDDNDNASVHDE